VETECDVAGRAKLVKGTVGAATKNYASAVQYGAHGGVTSLTLGNGAVETTTYNNRMQPTCLAASAAPAFQVGLAYGSGESVCGASTGAGNNGNVMKQRITRGSTVWNQTYTYDDVNRLRSVNEDAVSGGSSWGQTYDIDRWGNRAVMPAGYIPNPWQTATNLNEFGNNRWYG
jgi:hypothetical protein